VDDSIEDGVGEGAEREACALISSPSEPGKLLLLARELRESSLLDGSIVYGECKWSDRDVGEGVLDRLIERAALTTYGRGNDRRYFVLYTSKAFTNAVEQRAAQDPQIVLHNPSTMLGHQQARRRKRAGHL